MASTEDAKSPALKAAELRKAQAEADLAEANAAKAKLERKKLEEEQKEWVAESQNRRDAAAAALKTTQLENEGKQIDNESTQRSWISEIGPDLSKVERGKTEGADKPLFTTILASKALEDAAHKVAAALFPSDSVDGKVLLTTDSSLVDRLAIRAGVLAEIKASSQLITAMLGSAPEAATDDPGKQTSRAELAPLALATGLASAAAKTVPGLLSLLAANRTLSTAEVAQDAYVTLVAVAGALRARKNPPSLILDETRILRGTTQVEKDFGILQLRKGDLTSQIALFGSDEREEAIAWSTKAKAALDVVDATLTTLSKVDEKAMLSPLMTAASQEVFADPSVKHIVVIAPAGASTVQLVDDRPLWAKDTFDIRTTSAIAYVCINPDTNEVEQAGVKTGSARKFGTIGSEFD